MKKALAILLISSVLLSSSGCSSNELTPVNRDAFLEGLETNCGIDFYSTEAITPTNLISTVSALGGEYQEYDYVYWDYALRVDNSTLEDVEYCFYAEISHNVDINEALENTDIFTMIGLLPYHYERNVELSQICCYGDINSDRYLVYTDVNSYDDGTEAKVLLYRNEYTIWGFIAYSDSVFNYFTDSMELPRYDETDCYFDFEGDDITVDRSDSVYIYQHFDSNDSALAYFANYYNSYLDMCLDDGFDGYFRNDWGKALGYAAHQAGDNHSGYEYTDQYYGYITLNGKFDDPQYIINADNLYYIEDDFYGGIYLHDNTVIIVYTSSSSEHKQENIDELLSSFDYPVPPKKNRTIFEGFGNKTKIDVPDTGSASATSTTTTTAEATTVVQTTVAETTTTSETTTEITTTPPETTPESSATIDISQMSIDDVAAIVIQAYGGNLNERTDIELNLSNEQNSALGLTDVRYYQVSGDWTSLNENWMVDICIMKVDESSTLENYASLDQELTMFLISDDGNGTVYDFPVYNTAVNGQYILSICEIYATSEDESTSNSASPFYFESANNATDAFNAI